MHVWVAMISIAHPYDPQAAPRVVALNNKLRNLSIAAPPRRSLPHVQRVGLRQMRLLSPSNFSRMQSSYQCQGHNQGKQTFQATTLQLAVTAQERSL